MLKRSVLLMLLFLFLVVTVVIVPISLAGGSEGTITLNHNFTGFLEPGQPDYWALSFNPLDQVEIIGHSGDFDIALTLFEGEIPVAWDDNSYGEQDAALLTVFRSDPANYYLIVASNNPNASGNYELSMQSALFYGQHIQKDIKNRFNEAWLFYGNAGDEMTILLHSKDFDTKLALHNRYGQLAVDDNGWTAAGSTTDSMLNVVLPDNGVYFIDVAGDHGQVLNGAYLLNLWPTLHPGQIIRAFLQPNDAHLFHIMGQTGDKLRLEAKTEATYHSIDLIIYGHGVNDQISGEDVWLDVELPYPDHSVEVRSSLSMTDWNGWYTITMRQMSP